MPITLQDRLDRGDARGTQPVELGEAKGVEVAGSQIEGGLSMQLPESSQRAADPTEAKALTIE